MPSAASYRAVGIALAAGWVGLDETMTWLQLLGAALVLGGVVLVSVKRKG